MHLIMRPPEGRRRHISVGPYLLVAPTVAFVLLIFFYPISTIFVQSFLSPTATGGSTVGLANYQFVASDPVFWTSTRNNLFFLLGVPIMTALALVFAVVIFDRPRGWRIYRTVIFTPYILAVPVVGLTFVYLYGFNGIVNTVLRGIGAGGLSQDWLGSPSLVTTSILSVIIYRELGFGVILFLARLSSIDQELYEAAEIDGAGWWARLRFITIPELGTVIGFFVTIELITMLSWVFAYVYSMTGGGPAFASSILELYIWQNAFAYRAIGIASAVAVVLLAGMVVLIIIQTLVRSRGDAVSDG